MKNQRTHLAVFAVGLVLSVSNCLYPSLASAEEPVKIGAFNVQNFGEKKVSQPHLVTVLAQIATQFDLIAIEEVGSNGSSATNETCVDVMTKYVEAINFNDHSTDYAYVQGNQYGIVFRTSRFDLSKVSLYQGSQPFSYTPLTAFVRAKEGKLDFSVIVVHTSPKLATSEIPALTVAMAEVAKQNGDPDVVCFGDFNGDGSYYKEGKDSFLSGFPPDQYISAIKNSEDTTVATSSNTYDRIELSKTMGEDFEGESGVLEYTKTMDVSQVEGTAKTAGTAMAVSDHWPVWAKLWTDRDTD